MLPDELWGELGLRLEEVRRRARFFSAYAKLAAEPGAPTAVQLAERSRNGDLPDGPGLATFGEVPRPEDEQFLELRRARQRPRWAQLAEQADALRESAIANLLLGAEEGRSLLWQAGSAYAMAGLPYGTFLGSVAESDEDWSWRALRLLTRSPLEAEEEPPVGDTAMRIPGQQLHLCLAMAGSRIVSEEGHRQVEHLWTGPQGRSAAPFGTSGGTLSEWWSFGRQLLTYQPTGKRLQAPTEDRPSLREMLVRFGLEHGDRLERARLDRHHWKRLRAPVDLIDLDLAGATCIAIRRLRQHGEELGVDAFRHLPPLARISLTVGIQMAEEEGPEATDRRTEA